MKKSVPTEVRIERHQQWCLLSQVHSEKCLVSIHFWEFGCSCQYVCNLFESRCFVVLSYDCFVEILRIKTNPQLTVGFLWVCQWADPWCRFHLFCNYSLADHLIQLFFDLCFVLDQHLASSVLQWWYTGVGLMSYLLDISPIRSKELENRVCRSLVLLIWTLPGSTYIGLNLDALVGLSTHLTVCPWGLLQALKRS